MKTVLIIDGYNVIRRTRSFERALDSSLEYARSQFIGAIVQYRRKKFSFDEIIVVFDGQGGQGVSTGQRHGPVATVFSRSGESADDRIRSLIRQKIGRCRTTVVSDDNYVTNSARAHGADTMSCGSFLKMVEANARGRMRKQSETGGQGDKSEPNEKMIDDETMADINESLKKRWLIE